MKKNVLFMLIALCVSISSARAYDFSAVYRGNTIYYNIVNGNAVVTYRTNPGYNNASYSGTVYIPSTVTYNGTTYSVTGIGEKAFHFSTNLTSIEIGANITTIGTYAFACCGLTSVTIPNSVTSIGSEAFLGCSSLTSVTIPNSVTSIESSVFSGCSGLTSVTIPNSVTSVGDYAFFDCSGLTSVTIPNSVTSLGDYAFSYCSGLTSVTIPNSVTSIGRNAFYGCNSLVRVNYTGTIAEWCGISFTDSPANPLSHAHHLYLNNQEITTLSIPNAVTTIGNYAFFGCSGLTSVSIPNSVTSIGSEAFSGCSSLTSVTIPNSVTSIESSVFSGCSGLTSVTIPNSVTSLGDYAFSNCSGLASVSIPNSVTTIGHDAFYGCSVLSLVSIANSVTSIGNLAFSGCSNIATIICQASTPPSIAASGVFSSNLSTIPVCIPVGSLENYYSSNWSYYFSNFIEGIPSVYTITVNTNNSSYGSAAGGGQYLSGTTATLTATANSGYHFVQWQDGNTSNPRTITVTGDATYTATFEADALTTYTISTQVNPANAGTVSGGGTYEQGATATLTATANSGYHFVRWQDGNTSNPRTITVTGDATYTATFEADAPTTYTISTQANPANAGTVSGGGTYEQGATATLTATANSGYHFAHWQDGSTSNPRTVTVTGNSTYTAYFEEDAGDDCVWFSNLLPTDQPRYLIGHDRDHGIYTYAERFENTGTVAIDTIKIKPATVSSNTPNSSSIKISIHNEQSGRPGTTIASYTVPYANFAENVWNLFYISNPVRVTGNYYVSFTCNETPYSDDFEIWTTDERSPGTMWAKYNGNWYSCQELYTGLQISMFIETHACPAETPSYTITVQASPSNAGTVTGGGTYPEGSAATIKATPKSGYRFVRWNDNNTQSTRTITVTADATYTAYFQSTQGIDSTNVPDLQIYPNPTMGMVQIEGDEVLSVEVLDVQGRSLQTATISRIDLSRQPAGTYLLRITTADSVIVRRVLKQ